MKAVAAPNRTKQDNRSGLAVPSWVVMVAVLVGGTAMHMGLHYRAHGVVNSHHAVLSAFLVLNVLVNFWELGLLACADQVKAEYLATKGPYRGREMVRIGEVFQHRIPIGRLLSFREWTGIWSGYALFDPGYAERHSFGFNIDVWNAITTLIPATLFAFSMTYGLVPPRALGIIGVAMFWQMFFGTIVYFFQFFFARRHVGHGWKNVAIFVGSTNGLWFIFPLWGIGVSVVLIYQSSYAVFLR